MAVTSALRASHPLPPGRFLVLISVRSRVDPRAIVWLEGLGEMKSPVTSSGSEPVTFRLVKCMEERRVQIHREKGKENRAVSRPVGDIGP
jgi:hypothetical protein